ncbi:MAG: Na/Pi cotransporter family protein [Treponema sp.]|nr:Na/Pi cotransporter family protein [Treponema sp.]
MTGNRLFGVLTGLSVTAIIQSSLATTVMTVSFVNAGLLNLTQAIGVIMGANIGTTVTAWIVSLVGFSLNISSLSLPLIGIGFILSIIKWKYKSLGDIILGFGLLFMGLYYLTQEMGSLNQFINFNALSKFQDMGFTAVLISAGAGLVMTYLIHSSSASTAIVITMAFNNIVTYEMAAGMVLGANVGTTFDAALMAIGTKTAAKRAALVHVLFNIIGSCWALPLMKQLLALVNFITPGDPIGFGVTIHIAMLHTVFNIINTILFLPFVNPFANLVSLIIKDKEVKSVISEHYEFVYKSTSLRDTPELNIIRAEKEIRDMAGVASYMYGKFSAALNSIQEKPLSEEAVTELVADLKNKENYADEMREAITAFLIECTRERLNIRSERRVSRLLRIVADLEDMTDDCFSISIILERSVIKQHVFKNKETMALIPYVGMVAEFLDFLNRNLGGVLSADQAAWAKELENNIDKSRNKLRKLSRKRIEAGKDVKTELLFIDLVRRVEKLGDYCYNIAAALTVS